MLEPNSPGESPPPPPRALFGRDELVEEIVGLVDSLTPIALIGAGGIGKTSIALAILHHDRIKKRFGENRRFIRCDQFPATPTHFLCRLSKVIGAGLENPEELASLRPFLSSKEILIILDNAESVLDPQGTNGEEIYAMVEELSQFDNICLCVTSRVSTTPPDCKTLDIPTLSAEAARNTFYRIYGHSERSDLVSDILKRLDFHPLSITLLATVAHHNKWNTDRLTREWERRRIGVLRTHHNRSLAATIELSLASPMFQDLGPDARDLLGVIAFFPQGIDENNLDWLFPTISNGEDIFDKFCVLSLTYRSNGFGTMLAPLRDYLCPKDPKTSPLLCATRDHYFSRLLVDTDPDEPGFEETRWIVSEDVNVEHLLDLSISTDANSTEVWKACANFIRHLNWHKRRFVALGPKIEGLPDDHPSKPQCLFEFSQSLNLVGNNAGCKSLLIHALRLWGEWGNNLEVARTLSSLAFVDWASGLRKEGIQRMEEALAMYERLADTARQAAVLLDLALLLVQDDQVNAAEEAASRAISLSDEPKQRHVCIHHHILAHICQSRGEKEMAINHLNTAFRIAVSLNLWDEQAKILVCLVKLLHEAERFDDAQVHLEYLKSQAGSDPFNLGYAMVTQAHVWFHAGRFEEAKAEVLRATDVFEKIGVSVGSVAPCKTFLQYTEGEMNGPVTSNE